MAVRSKSIRSLRYIISDYPSLYHSSIHYRFLRGLSENKFNGTIPSQLANLAKLKSLYSLAESNFSSKSHCLHYRCFRYLYMNQLTGTIPPKLGNFSVLSFLYSHCIVLIDNVNLFGDPPSIFSHCESLHCSYLALSGSSTLTSSLAPSPLSSATSLSSEYCTHSLASFSLTTFMISDDLSCILSSHTIAVWFVSLSLSQGPLLESAYRHHPTSAGQPHSLVIFVRSQNRITVLISIWWFIFNLFHHLSFSVLMPSLLHSQAPQH